MRKIDNLIARDGWAVTGVGEDNSCHDPGCTSPHEEQDPFLYTVGLTAAGLPELLLEHVPAARAVQILNDLARKSLAAGGDGLTPGTGYADRAGGWWTVEAMTGPQALLVCKVAKVKYGARLRAQRVLPVELVLQ